MKVDRDKWLCEWCKENRTDALVAWIGKHTAGCRVRFCEKCKCKTFHAPADWRQRG